MGVIFSEHIVEFEMGTLDLDEKVSISNIILRVSYENAKCIVDSYLKYQYPVVVDYVVLCSLFENAMRAKENVNETMKRIAVLWKIYQQQSV